MTATLSIVLPVANQEDHIERVVEAHLGAVRSLPCDVEFVLAVNNSRDGSLACCERLAEAHPGSVVVVSARPGWGNAVVGGLHASRGTLIGFTNSARTHSADLVRAVNHALVDPSSLVKGWRVDRDYSLARRAGSRIFNTECHLLFGIETLDVNGFPKVWPRALLPPDLLTEPGSFLDAEILIRARERRIPVIELPITQTERHGGVSMTNLRLAMTLYARPVAARLGRGPRRPAAALVAPPHEAA